MRRTSASMQPRQQREDKRQEVEAEAKARCEAKITASTKFAHFYPLQQLFTFLIAPIWRAGITVAARLCVTL